MAAFACHSGPFLQLYIGMQRRIGTDRVGPASGSGPKTDTGSLLRVASSQPGRRYRHLDWSWQLFGACRVPLHPTSRRGFRWSRHQRSSSALSRSLNAGRRRLQRLARIRFKGGGGGMSVCVCVGGGG